MSNKTGTVSQSNLDRLNEVRAVEDLNMVHLTGVYLEDYISKASKELFLTNPSIMLVVASTPGVQRNTINRYFTTKLLLFTNRTNIPTMDQMMLLVNDGEPKDWFELFREFILPFFKEHGIA